MLQPTSEEQTWLDEDTALKAAARKGWGFESLLLRTFSEFSFNSTSLGVLSPCLSGFCWQNANQSWINE
jgi:hypothetical protein